MTDVEPKPLNWKVAKELERARRKLGAFLKRRSGQLMQVRLKLGRVRARLDYRRNPLRMQADSFLLVRIIGNDLEPRHEKGQSRRSIEFILAHEDDFPGCEKLWVLNRLVDPEERAKIISILDSRDQNYAEIPFDLDAYGKENLEERVLGKNILATKNSVRDRIFLFRNKINYLMNNNGARNFALEAGRDFKWIMPWDGNCYLTREAFEAISRKIRRRPHLPYVIVPMARIDDNKKLLQSGFSERADEEPQIIFRRDARESFNPEIPYGRRPKVDLLWRLGVAGRWDNYPIDPWDAPKPGFAKEAGLFHRAGWVARLDLGRPELEIGKGSSGRRAASRDEAILLAVENADRAYMAHRLASQPDVLHFYDREAIRAAAGNEALAAEIRAHADAAMRRGPYSVMDKTSVAPSGDKHDYFSLAPYWWTDAEDGEDGFVRRDGERVPGSIMGEEGSEQFDRTSLQGLLDDTTLLALGWGVTGKAEYAEKAADLIRVWFLRPQTRMNPHLTFAQIIRDEARAKGFGIIEFKDVHYFLDAVRLVIEAGALSGAEADELKLWFSSYAQWLDASSAAQGVFPARNNHGLYFDLQRLSIACSLGMQGHWHQRAFMRGPGSISSWARMVRSRRS